ncbi:GATA transcription factor 26-like isoform X2 [Macadamia integrifolia]|uniref:GATA transcription factor 26-like isoform X2 n=1 Tax=Macadamia integrifolia TaxID=60698 RepID=UPI001C4EB273|nr:GATA transcription factor 26-like isoform X2 [Macadamia integrifolia]
MGKQGPCRHCGTTCTPLWRNGPPGKPVLCNACGSRWRTRGTLTNYTPLHSRTFEHLDTKVSHKFQACKIPLNTNTKKLCEQVCDEGYMEGRDTFAGYDLCPKSFENDTSNRSSSGSAISCSESSVRLGRMDGNKISGPVKSNFWDFPIPTKKRSKTRSHSPSPVEKLRRNLVDIQQEQESSYQTENPEDVLIFKKQDPLLSPEIGLGAILLKPSLSFTGEESEASSPIMENNVSCLNNGDVESSCLTLRSQSSEYSSQESNGLIQETGYAEELKVNVAKQSAITNKSSGTALLGNPDILQNTNSPLMPIYWKPENGESFTIMNNMAETTSCLSHHIGGGISLHAERNPNLPYLPTSGGPSFDTIGGFEVPNQQMVGHNPPSSISMPAFSIGRNSSIVPLQMVATYYNDVQMRVHPGNNFPVVRLPSISALQNGANDEETRSAAEIFQHPNNRNIN